MKVLYIHTFYSPTIGGGAEITLKSIVEGIQSRGHEVCVLTTGGEVGLNQDIVDGVKVYRAGLKNVYWHFTKTKPDKYLRVAWHLLDVYNGRMKKYVEDVIALEKPDVISCHNLTGFSISSWNAISAAKIPIIQVLHDLYLLCANSNMFKNGHACKAQCTACSILRLPHKKASKAVTAVVGVSSFVLNRLTSFGYFTNATKVVINNARSIADHQPQKNLLDLSHSIKFGYIGTLVASKGIELLIKEFLSIDDPNATLTIAGSGKIEYVNYLKTLADSDKIKFVGYIKSSDFYSQIDVSIVPSLWPDTFPGVAFESCAHHVPVIASNIGGLPEIIRDRENGLLCDITNPKSLLTALNLLSNDRALLDELSKSARESVSKLLSINRMLDEHELLYNSVLQKY